MIEKFIQRGEFMKSKRMLSISLAILIMASCFIGNDAGLLKMQTVYANTLIPYVKEDLPIPTNVTVKTTCKTLTVSWCAVEGAESYFISLNDNCINVKDNIYTYNNLQPDTKYTVKVRAVIPYVKEGWVGDINLDWQIDSLDFALLRTYLLTDKLPMTEKMLTDKNNDGSIDSVDASLVEFECLTLADVNGDYNINSIDFAMLKNRILRGDGFTFPKCESLWSAEITAYTKETENVENNFAQISASYSHTAVLKEDGTVWTWGDNIYGQLGDGTKKYSSTPVKVDISGVKAVIAANGRTIALKEDGTVWSWGTNDYGQLGDGTKGTNSIIPVKADITGVKAIAAGDYYTAALKEDGTVWEWGYADYSRLGLCHVDYSGISCNLKPKQIEISGVKALDADGYYTAALKENGTVWVWGNYYFGLPENSVGSGIIKIPFQIEGISGVKAIAAGGEHIAALKEDGTVWTWGYNYNGQLGNETARNTIIPVKAEISGVKEIDSGGQHTAALKDDGTVWTWGHNDFGQLGNGTTRFSFIPVKAEISEVKKIAAGGVHTVALKNDGTVWAWGTSKIVQIDDIEIVQSSFPVLKVIED